MVAPRILNSFVEAAACGSFFNRHGCYSAQLRYSSWLKGAKQLARVRRFALARVRRFALARVRRFALARVRRLALAWLALPLVRLLTLLLLP
jgi:hypothetical protein